MNMKLLYFHIHSLKTLGSLVSEHHSMLVNEYEIISYSFTKNTGESSFRTSQYVSE